MTWNIWCVYGETRERKFFAQNNSKRLKRALETSGERIMNEACGMSFAMSENIFPIMQSLPSSGLAAIVSLDAHAYCKIVVEINPRSCYHLKPASSTVVRAVSLLRASVSLKLTLSPRINTLTRLLIKICLLLSSHRPHSNDWLKVFRSRNPFIRWTVFRKRVPDGFWVPPSPQKTHSHFISLRLMMNIQSINR